MLNSLSSFMVRETEDANESAEPSISAGAFLSALDPYSPQTQQFIARGLISLPGGSIAAEGYLSGTEKEVTISSGGYLNGTEKVILHTGSEDGTGGFLTGAEKVILRQTGRDDSTNRIVETLISGVEGTADGGFLTSDGKVLLQAGTGDGNPGSFLSLQAQAEDGGSEGAFLSEKVILQAQTEEGHNEGTFLGGSEKVIIQAQAEEGESSGTFLTGAGDEGDGRVTQGPLLYLDSATGLHVLVHHLPNSSQNNAGSEGDDNTEEQFVVVGALQSEEEQQQTNCSDTVVVEQQSQHHHNSLNTIDPHQVTVETMLRSHLVTTASNSSESPISAHQLFQAHLDSPINFHTSVSPKSVSRGQQSITTTTPLITIQRGNGMSNQTADATLTDCSESSVLTLQVPRMESETVEMREDILEAVPQNCISLEDIIEKFTSEPHEDDDVGATIAGTSNPAFPSITLLKDSSLDLSSHNSMLHLKSGDMVLHNQQNAESFIQHKSELALHPYKVSCELPFQHKNDITTTRHNTASDMPSTTTTTTLQHHRLSQDTTQHHRSSQRTTKHQRSSHSITQLNRLAHDLAQNQRLSQSLAQHHKLTKELQPQHIRKCQESNTSAVRLAPQDISARSISSLSSRSLERSGVRVKILDTSQDLLPHSDRDDGSDAECLDDESLYDVVMTYRCKLCAQVFEEKMALLRHHREVHKPGGAVKIRVTTTSERSGASCLPSTTVSDGSGSGRVASITHKLGQENEEPRELNILSCGFCSKDFLGEQEFRDHLKKDHPKKGGGRKGGRKSGHFLHGRLPSYPTQPGLLIGHRNTRLSMQAQQDEGKEEVGEVSDGKKRRVRTPKNLNDQYYLQKQKVQPVYSEEVDKKFSCVVYQCKYKFSNPKNLSLHQECHGRPDAGDHRTFNCPHCNVSFCKWVLCQMHLWKNHNVDVDLLTCGICHTYKTCTSQRLIVHQKTHSDDRDHICTECGKGFRTLSQRLNHEVIHIKCPSNLPVWKQKGYCIHCQRWLGDKKTLRAHITAVHLKFKPFECSQCTYRCSRKFDLKVHERQHSGERPYKCELCGWQCKDHNSMRRHRTIHLDLKPLRCPHTNCVFKTNHGSYFKRHITKKHDNAPAIYCCHICLVKTMVLQEYISHTTSHEKELVTEAYNKRLGKTAGEGANVVTIPDQQDEETPKQPGKAFKACGNKLAKSTSPQVITIDLEGAQGNKTHIQGLSSNTSTYKTHTQTKETHLQIHADDLKAQTSRLINTLEPEIIIEEPTLDDESARADSGVEGLAEEEEEQLIEMEEDVEEEGEGLVMMAGDGQQYIIGISEGHASSSHQNFFTINRR